MWEVPFARSVINLTTMHGHNLWSFAVMYGTKIIAVRNTVGLHSKTWCLQHIQKKVCQVWKLDGADWRVSINASHWFRWHGHQVRLHVCYWPTFLRTCRGIHWYPVNAMWSLKHTSMISGACSVARTFRRAHRPFHWCASTATRTLWSYCKCGNAKKKLGE